MTTIYELHEHDNFAPSIVTVLRQRGFVHAGCCEQPQVLEVPDYPRHFGRWVDCLKEMTARKLLRKIISSGGASRRELQGISKDPALLDYLALFTDIGVVDQDSDTVRVTKAVDNFGPTLEWYTAHLLSTEFEAVSCWAVKIQDVYGGGDFDVLAWLDSVSALVYIECKSARPSEVDESELRSFLQRCQELAPEVAILLVDTDSNLQPLLDRTQAVLLPIIRKTSRTGDDWVPDEPFISAISGEAYSGIHFGLRRVFITRSIPSIATQLRKCLRYYSTFVRHASFLSGPRIDYIKGEVLDG